MPWEKYVSPLAAFLIAVTISSLEQSFNRNPKAPWAREAFTYPSGLCPVSIITAVSGISFLILPMISTPQASDRLISSNTKHSLQVGGNRLRFGRYLLLRCPVLIQTSPCPFVCPLSALVCCSYLLLSPMLISYHYPVYFL